MDITIFLIIYVTGCIVSLITFPAFIYKNTGIITVGNIIISVLFATASWITTIAIIPFMICDKINMDKVVFKRKKK